MGISQADELRLLAREYRVEAGGVALFRVP